MRPFQKTLSFIFLAVLVSASIFFAPQALAAGDPPLPLTGFANGKSLYDYSKEFCDKRSGDLMNLETWYSGKCGVGVDTLSGDGIGFSDIVILQGIETLIGPQYYTFTEMLVKMLTGLKELKSKFSNPSVITQNQGIDFALDEKLNGGIIPSIAKITTSVLIAKPASSTEYLAYVSSNLKSKNVIKEAYAASPGYGFTALSPILPLWRAFRNIAYLLFALVFVLYGIMIMFRVKIDAKTAASIQLAVPKLVVTLLLITFSYSIVGLLVDVSTVATYLVINVLQVGGILNSSNHIMVGLTSGLFAGAVGSWFINSIIATIVSPFVVFNLLIGGATGTIIAAIVALITTVFSLGIIPLIISIAIMLMIAYGYIKLTFKLFEAFFSILVSLIFAPIIILGNVIPGSNAFSGWIMTIIGNLAVFPTASFFLVLSYALMVQPLLNIASIMPTIASTITGFDMQDILGVKLFSTGANLWTPPMTIPGIYMTSGGTGTGTATGGVGSLMLATIGFGLLLMASKYVDMVRDALKVPPFKYGTAIGEAMAVPGKVAKVTYKAAKEVVDLVKP